MAEDRFYITTPIYYVNDVPHIGHAYTTIAADILARYNRLQGKTVFFLTGTDEHGQKVEKAAKEKGRTPQEHADMLVDNFKSLWQKLNISNDAFIRTTDTEHVKTVQGIIQLLWDNGEIEKRQYSGWYCTPDERFWTEKEIIEGNCPDCGRPVDEIEEENYFFLMSKYQLRLIRHIEDNPDFILPHTRRNEVLGFLKNNELGDLCITRPKSRLSWGIQLPFDEEFVTYVWFDALLNYFSATRYLVPHPEQAKEGDFWWPADHHLIGKDILTTHSVYWITMLMALKFPLPGNIFAHGWWTVDGKKMSKSLGNVVDPAEMAEKFGIDAFRYFLFREVTFGLDGDFSERALIRRLNTELANDLGNLLSRFVTMVGKYQDHQIKIPSGDRTELNPFAREIMCETLPALNDIQTEHWSKLRFNTILDYIWNIIRAANNHIAQKEPWKLAKDNQSELNRVLFNVWNALRLTAVSLYPFMPDTCENIWKQLGLHSLVEETIQSIPTTSEQIPSVYEWDWKPDYAIKVSKGDPLFPRVDTNKRDKKEKKAEGSPAGKDNKTKEAGDNLITIHDFAKVQLKVGRVIDAQRVEGSSKLIRLQVDTGEIRQIVAGIGTSYSPDDLRGKSIIVVTNLKPAKLMGVESQGMLLAATDSEGVLSILTPEKDVRQGAVIR
ncbi:MAG: methionine--tRNA ligase [Nitrospiraceae bacterium]|nr:MAG: methionine--tRNA ligase [Nitrospiraceae bacterium]